MHTAPAAQRSHTHSRVWFTRRAFGRSTTQCRIWNLIYTRARSLVSRSLFVSVPMRTHAHTHRAHYKCQIAREIAFWRNVQFWFGGGDLWHTGFKLKSTSNENDWNPNGRNRNIACSESWNFYWINSLSPAHNATSQVCKQWNKNMWCEFESSTISDQLECFIITQTTIKLLSNWQRSEEHLCTWWMLVEKYQMRE